MRRIRDVEFKECLEENIIKKNFGFTGWKHKSLSEVTDQEIDKYF